MALSANADKLIMAITGGKLGDIKRHAKAIRKDHDLALELWGTGAYKPRLLSILILDKKCLTQDLIEKLAVDMLAHEEDERDQLTDWLLANQLMKDKKLTERMETWERHPSPVLRRLFWYHQARLRWTGKASPGNTDALMDALERELAGAEPGVQWAMNFCAGQIGIHEPAYRSRCIALGEKLGLYRDEVVPRNCTPSYLPEFIRIEVAKLPH